MTVNGHRLPEEFLEALSDPDFIPNVGSKYFKDEFDSYGNVFESELGTLYATSDAIAAATAKLSEHFVADDVYGASSDPEDAPGAIPDILDFSQLLCFGTSGDGAPFCFDYRGNPDSPDVIWWDDFYWRKVSPNFKTFLELFDAP